MSFLTDIEQCINKNARLDGKAKLALRDQHKIDVSIKSDGPFLHYQFENLKQPLFPFFANSVEGLNSIADSVIFSEDAKGQAWAFIIELKNNKGNPHHQLWATQDFVNYIIKVINRSCRTGYSVEIRRFGYSKIYRPPTRVRKPFRNGFANISGDTFFIPAYQI